MRARRDLVDTATAGGEPGFNGTVVEGRTAGTNDAGVHGERGCAGNVTLDQIRAVVHPTNNPNEPKTLSADNLVTLTATITDKDGDSATRR